MKFKNKLVGLLVITVLTCLSSCNLLPFSSSSSSSKIPVGQPNVARLLAINDTHGRLVSNQTDIGMDAISYQINELEKESEYIKIANGDIFQGTYESNVLHGRPIIECLNKMDFDALVIGNHEFDWGIETIAQYKDGNSSNGEANFTFLACNIYSKETNALLPWLEPYTIVENAGKKVGIIGAIGENLTSSIAGRHVKDYKFLETAPLVAKYCKELKEEKDVDLVVLAIHEYNEGNLYDIVSYSGNEKVDAIFTAHTHQYEKELFNNVPILQGACNNEYISTMKFDLLNNKQLISYENIPVSKDKKDPDITNIINYYVEGEVKEKGQEVIGYNNYYKNNYEMAELFAQAMYEKYDVDVAITNKAREGLSSGDITIEDMYKVYPFDNIIITSSISGAKLHSFVNYADSMLYNKNFSLSNIQNSYSVYYDIVIIDYVFDNQYYTYYFSQDPQYRVEQNVYMRDLMIEYIKSVKTI